MHPHEADEFGAMVDYALDYARRGLPVFPCNPSPDGVDGKKPLVARDKDANGAPIPKTGGLYKATTDEDQIRAWWRRWPDAMIGLRMGPESGVFAIDPGMPKDEGDPNGLEAWMSLAAAHGYKHFTHAHITPRGGMHLLFAYPEGIDITNSSGRLPPGIDTRGAGGYVIAPPSRLKDGRAYRLEEPEHAFHFAPAPDFVLDLLRKPEPPPRQPPPKEDKPKRKQQNGGSRFFDGEVPDSYIARAVEDECAGVASAGKGNRNKALNKAAFKLGTLVGANRLDAGFATRRLLDAAIASGLVADEGQPAALATIESGLTSGAQHPREFPDRKPRSGASTQGRSRPEPDGSEGGHQGENEDQDEDPRTIVKVVAGEVPRAVVETEAAILASGLPIYTRAGMLVRPVIDRVPAASGRTTTASRFTPMCTASMADHAARVVRYMRFDGRCKDWVTINPPAEIMSALLARDGQWRLSSVVGIVNTPTLRPDGSILSRPGYDPATRLYLVADEGFRMPSVPDAPTREQAEAALKLIESLLVEFPFVQAVDKAVALSGILTALVRGVLPTAPLHAIRAHSPGTGKSFLVDLASVLATGRRCPVIAAGKTEEETEKRLGALLRDAVPVVSIDNVNGELGGDMLCQMTERPLVRVRILGKSEAPELECRSTTFATGNNLVLVGDMTRRTVLCTLDAGVERPELREFEFDPLRRVYADRGAYVAAAFTVIRAYRTAGSPKVCGSVGSYDEWSAAVRAPLIWLGHVDPVASMETARDEDPELSAIRELFEHWREQFYITSDYKTSAIIKAACEKGPGASFDYGVQEFKFADFRDLLLRQAGDGGAVNSKRLGKWLSKISGRIVDGHRIEMKVDGKHGNRFSLIKVDREEQDGPPTEF